MHCDGCAKRIRASVRHYPGVEGVAMDEDKGTMTVVGRFDAKKLRDRVAGKTKKKVDLLPANNNNKNTKSNNDGDVKPIKQEEEQDDDKGGHGGGGKAKQGAKDSKKPLMPVVGTVVLKIGAVGLHCDGCMDRIRSKLFHIDGVEQVAMEMAKNQVTVTGTMDVKALPESLRRKLRRPVDVVQPPSSNSKQQKQDGGKDAAAKALAAEKEAWKAAFYDQQALMATEFMLSDENPNACTIT
uniref:HMA domain-containing protein n=2 Tax=Oryza brachyantha TaxID=4533 RepID=J3LIE8_ORYBR